MRRRAFILLFLAALLIGVAACDPLALPTPTPTAAPPTATAQATDTPNAPEATSTTEATPTTSGQLPTEPPQSQASPSGSPSGSSGTNAETQREITEIESDTIKVRGLKPKKDVPETFLPQDKLRENLTEEVNTE